MRMRTPAEASRSIEQDVPKPARVDEAHVFIFFPRIYNLIYLLCT